MDRDRVPDNMLDTAITWILFCVMLVSATRMADGVTGKMAIAIAQQSSLSTTPSTSSSAVKTSCVLLVAIATCLTFVFCMAEALLVIGVAGVAQFVVVGAVVIPEKASATPSPSRLRFWDAVQTKLDPGILTGFLAKRLWTSHLIVAIVAVVVPALYVIMLEKTDAGERKEGESGVFARMFKRALHLSNKVAVWLCVVVVVIREFSLASVNGAYRHRLPQT